MIQKPPSRVDLLRGTLGSSDPAHAAARPSHGHAIATHSTDIGRPAAGRNRLLLPCTFIVSRPRAGSRRRGSSQTRQARSHYRITPKGRKQPASEQSKWTRSARGDGLLPSPPTRRDDDLALRKLTWWLAAPQGRRAPRGAAVPSRRRKWMNDGPTGYGRRTPNGLHAVTWAT
jgi:hypothetical protein